MKNHLVQKLFPTHTHTHPSSHAHRTHCWARVARRSGRPAGRFGSGRVGSGRVRKFTNISGSGGVQFDEWWIVKSCDGCHII